MKKIIKLLIQLFKEMTKLMVITEIVIPLFTIFLQS